MSRGIIRLMDFELELARFNPDPALAEWLATTLRQADQTRQMLQARDTELKHANLKIAALTLELAHHKRIRFANQSEA